MRSRSRCQDACMEHGCRELQAFLDNRHVWFTMGSSSTLQTSKKLIARRGNRTPPCAPFLVSTSPAAESALITFAKYGGGTSASTASSLMVRYESSSTEDNRRSAFNACFEVTLNNNRPEMIQPLKDMLILPS